MENIISNIIIILAFSCTLLIVSQIFNHKIAIWPYFSHLLLISIVQDEDIFIPFLFTSLHNTQVNIMFKIMLF